MPLMELTPEQLAQIATVKAKRQRRATAAQVEEFAARIQRTVLQNCAAAVGRLEAIQAGTTEDSLGAVAVWLKQSARQLLDEATLKYPTARMAAWADCFTEFGYDPAEILTTDTVLRDALATLAGIDAQGTDLAATLTAMGQRFSAPDTPYP